MFFFYGGVGLLLELELKESDVVRGAETETPVVGTIQVMYVLK